MAHIILCDHCHLCCIFLICFFKSNSISCLQIQKICSFLGNRNSFVRQLILLFCNTVLQSHILCKLCQFFRHKQINTDIRSAIWRTDLCKLNPVAVCHVLIAPDKICQFFSLLFRRITVLYDHSIIMLQIPILNGSNITDGILDSKSYQHQPHTACNSKYSHNQTFFITEQIADSRFPGKAKMLPYKSDSLQKYSFSFLWCRRTHQRSRCFLEFFSTGKKCGTYRTHNRSTGRNQCKTHLIINGQTVGYIVIHDSVSCNDNIRNDLLTDQHTKNTSTNCSQKCVADIFGRYCCFLISQSLHGTDLGTLFLHHTGHSGQTDQRRHQKKDHRKYLSDILQSFCIISIICVFRKILSVCHHPLRLFQIFQFLSGIRKLLFVLFYFLFCFLFGILIFLLTILQVFFTLLQILFGIF